MTSPGASRKLALCLETSSPSLTPSLTSAGGSALCPGGGSEPKVTGWAVTARLPLLRQNLASLTQRTSFLLWWAEAAHCVPTSVPPSFHVPAFRAELPRKLKAAVLSVAAVAVRLEFGQRDAGRRVMGQHPASLKDRQRELALLAAFPGFCSLEYGRRQF